MITRRMFVGSLTGGLLAAPLRAEAQQAGKVYRVGLVFTTAPVSEMIGPDPVHESLLPIFTLSSEAGERVG